MGAEHDAEHTINTRRRSYDDDDAAASANRAYRPRPGGRYDSEEDRSVSPDPPGPRVLGKAFRNARVPDRFKHPTNIARYDGDTNLGLWLDDYRLACHSHGARDDDFIIRNLPLYLADTARTWFENLRANEIHCWEDLREIFIGNLQGTYQCPGNP